MKKQNINIANSESTENKQNSKNNSFGKPCINEERGWRLDHVINFDYLHHAYIMSRQSIDELVNKVCDECSIKRDDRSFWVQDIRRLIERYITTYDTMLEGEYEGDADELNLDLSSQGIGDAITTPSDLFYSVESFYRHTGEETAAYYIYGYRHAKSKEERANWLELIYNDMMETIDATPQE